MPGPTEIIIIGAVIFLLFGGKLLQRFFRNLGEGLRESRKFVRDLTPELDEMKQNAEKRNG